MRYGSVCSGIEAASVAWHALGWDPAFYSEIDPFAKAVLAHHYPSTPCHGDFTTIQEDDYDPINLLVGGTPCQSFSVAGLRKGLKDDRGNLTLEFVRLAQRLRPRWLVWENVPGVLSIDGGRAFGALLGGLEECGYGFAYRVLDAQYFGVPQRRRRVFVIGCFGDWRAAAEVLFEPESLRGNITPGKQAGENYTRETAKCLTARGAGGLNLDPETANIIPIHSQAFRHQNGGKNRNDDGRGNGLGIGKAGDPANTLTCAEQHAVAFGDDNMRVRRLIPVECERLQGFPDNYTNIIFNGKPASDQHRYKALGNSMHTGTMRWIGERINLVDKRIAA